MSRKDPSSVSIAKFFGKYQRVLLEAESRERQLTAARLKPLGDLLKRGESSPPLLWEEVSDWWPIQTLRAAAADHDAEAYKRLLHYFLVRLGVRPPAGVLIPFRWKRGRPEETEKIYGAWIAQGRPLLTWRVLEELAKAFYPEQFSKSRSDARLRKNLRDRVRGTIRRHDPEFGATKSRGIK